MLEGRSVAQIAGILLFRQMRWCRSLPAPALLATLTIGASCGARTELSEWSASAGTGGRATVPGQGGSEPEAGTAGSSQGAAGSGAGGTSTCLAPFAPCSSGPSCCSGICLSGICVECRVSGESCEFAGSCCSEICDSETKTCGCSGPLSPHGICKTDDDCCVSSCDATTSHCGARALDRHQPDDPAGGRSP